MRILLELFLTFVKVGLFTFGGGYAMVPVIHNICVEEKKWISHEEMMDITVIAESTPGPMAINAATYVGYKQGGIHGSIVSTIGIALPSFVLIYLVSTVLDNFLEITLIANAFRGIKIAVGVLILRVGLQMLKKMQKKPMPRIIAGCAFAVVLTVNFLSLKLSTIVLMLAAGCVSLALHLRKGGNKG